MFYWSHFFITLIFATNSVNSVKGSLRAENIRIICEYHSLKTNRSRKRIQNQFFFTSVFSAILPSCYSCCGNAAESKCNGRWVWIIIFFGRMGIRLWSLCFSKKYSASQAWLLMILEYFAIADLDCISVSQFTLYSSSICWSSPNQSMLTRAGIKSLKQNNKQIKSK